MIKHIVLVLMLLGGAISATKSATQNNKSKWRDFEYIRNYNAWLSSENAAGLSSLHIDRIALAEINATKAAGDYINYHQSSDHFTFGVKTESFFRLNPKVVFYGKIDYSNFTGKNMAGSAFIDPYYSPFDIISFAESDLGKEDTDGIEGTKGTKNLEKYHIVGAISADIYRGIILGGKIDYTTANYAKHKDLRHTNKLMDMSLSLGLSYRFNPVIQIGTNYFYRRSTEDVTFNTFGSTDKKYFSLISFGSFFGLREIYGSKLFTGDGSANPLFNKFHGGSFQADINITPQLSIFNDLSVKSRKGYYGVRTSSTVVFTDHESDIFQYTGGLMFKGPTSLHSLRVTLDNEKLQNHRNIYKEENTPGAGSTIVYYGSSKILDKSTSTLSVGYTGYLDIIDNNPKWELGMGMTRYKRDQISSEYPFYRKQNISSYSTRIHANRNIIAGDNMYSFSLGATYIWGDGTEKTDGIYGTPSGNNDLIQSMDAYLYREFNYFTNSAIKSEIGGRYSRLFGDIKGYVALNYEFSYSIKASAYIGRTLNSYFLRIGCVF